MRGVVGEKGRIASQISTAAARQHGHVTRRQLLQIGFAPRAITHRIHAGKLIVEHAGVYALEYRRREPIARAAAAVLACGARAVLSHLSAAALWDMRSRWPDPPQVTVAGDRRGRQHHDPPHQGAAAGGHPVPARDQMHEPGPDRTRHRSGPGPKQLDAAIEDARLAGFVRRAALLEIVDRLPNHPGATPLWRSVEGLAKTPTKSEFERQFLKFANRWGLPTPCVNARIAGHEADIVFEHERVIGELDGYDTHGSRALFESDRERDAATLAAGYVTIRITWERLESSPEREAERLRQILKMRRQRAA
jgi:hypothetical protein